jgi:hypothetical protein
VTFAEFKIKKLPFYIATGGEFIALFFWLFFMERFTAHGQWLDAILANVLLWIGFMIERVTVLWWANKNFGDKVKLPVPKEPKWIFLLWMTAITVSEIVVWVVFRTAYLSQTLAQYGPWVPVVAALAILFVGEQLQHSYELHAMKGLSWSSQFFKFNTAIITMLETAGGAGFLFAIRNPQWFEFAGEHQATLAYAVGGLSMLLGLGIEHVVEGQSLSPDSPN